MHEIFNDGVMRATVLNNGWVVVEWLTDTIGYLSKTVVKDLRALEAFIRSKGLQGWVLGSEVGNTNMHKLIEKFGGTFQKEADGYRIYFKAVTKCAGQQRK
jgi:hypothetical protein